MPGACGVARKRYGAPPEVGMSSTHANSSGMDPTETEVRALMKVLVVVDPHKTSVAAVDEALGELVERASFSQNSAGLRALERWAKGLPGRRWAVENAGAFAAPSPETPRWRRDPGNGRRARAVREGRGTRRRSSPARGPSPGQRHRARAAGAPPRMPLVCRPSPPSPPPRGYDRSSYRLRKTKGRASSDTRGIALARIFERVSAHCITVKEIGDDSRKRLRSSLPYRWALRGTSGASGATG
jgi:hypothetical protein